MDMITKHHNYYEPRYKKYDDQCMRVILTFYDIYHMASKNVHTMI